jgi:hypothetical protein
MENNDYLQKNKSGKVAVHTQIVCVMVDPTQGMCGGDGPGSTPCHETSSSSGIQVTYPLYHMS